MLFVGLFWVLVFGYIAIALLDVLLCWVLLFILCECFVILLNVSWLIVLLDWNNRFIVIDVCILFRLDVCFNVKCLVFGLYCGVLCLSGTVVGGC